MSKILVIRKPRSITFEEIEDKKLNSTELRIKTLFSGISHGTEMHGYRSAEWLERRPFLRTPGYATVGEVVETGEKVTIYKEGDIVTSSASHVTHYVRDEKSLDLAKLPSGIPPEIGIFRFNLRVALNSLLDSSVKIGETVVIFGLGAIGQMVAQLAKLSGADQVIGIDLFDKRLQLAKKLGIDVVINPNECIDISAEIKKLTQERGADLAIEVSGSYKALNEAIKVVAYQGVVVGISWYSGPAQDLCLDEDYHNKRIKLISSMQAGINPELSSRWTKERREQVALNLLTKLKLKELISHTYAFADAAEAYRVIDQHPEEVIQVIIKYS